MYRALKCRSLITEVISRGLASKHDPCKVHDLLFATSRSKIPSTFSSNFHTSKLTRNQEPHQAENAERKQEEYQLDEEPEQIHRESGRKYADKTESSPNEEFTGGDRREGVIERLRRLSMTDADEYELSPMAKEKVREMSKIRAEMIKNGEQWKWDQRNLRPDGPAPSYRQQWGRGGGYNRRENDYGMRRNQYNDEDDDYVQERRYSRNQNVNDRRGGSFNSRSTRYDDDDGGNDEPENYEVEMQKLRERMLQNKRKAAMKAPAGDVENERNNFTNIPPSSKLAHARRTDSPALSAANSDLPYVGNESIVDHKRASSNVSPDYQVNFELAERDPDQFGNLSFAASNLVKDTVGEEIRNELLREEQSLSPIEEEEEEDDSRFIPPFGERWTTPKLIIKVRDLLKEKKLKEAVDTYLGVLKEGGFQFHHLDLRHQFNVLINECANAGYVEMAFRLFNIMKKRGYREKSQTISSLLNACANSPWDKENNLDRIDKLLINMEDRGNQLNLINYHVLIKAYGRLGETIRAFNVVDKMIEEAKIMPITETFNMLLQACISDTKNGFRYTLITWKKMLSMKKIRPDIYSYNLLLRAVRDCGIELKKENLVQISEIAECVPIDSSVPLLPPVMTEEDSDRVLSVLLPESLPTGETQIFLDNLGEPSIVDVKMFIKALSYPTNRLAVLGGVRGIISQMVRHKVPPNLKTVTELLHISRSTEVYDVLQLLDMYKIKPDIGFFNSAIRRCYELSSPKQAQMILKLMNNVYHLTPNIDTYKVLAFGCTTWIEAKTLLTQMDDINFTPNIYVIGSLLGSAIKNCDPKYVIHLIEETRRREIQVGDKFVLSIDGFIEATQRNLVSHEMGKHVESKNFVEALERNREFAEHFQLLKMRYKEWIQLVEIKVDPVNPWKADFEYFKENRRHKPVEEDDRRYEAQIKDSTESSN